MDETGIMLFILSFTKGLIGKDNRRDCRGTSIKWMIVTAIKCVAASSKYLNMIIIWPVPT
jgi:hypothetical protein